MEEKDMEARMSAITDEFAQLPQMGSYNLTLEEYGDAVRVLMENKNILFEKIIHADDDLDFVVDTFNYPNTFSPRSKMIALEGLKWAYFDQYGVLIVIHDDSTEHFKVSPANRTAVEERLRSGLGDKFNKPPLSSRKPAKAIKDEGEKKMLFKINFTLAGKRDYFIVAGTDKDKIRNTAIDILAQRGVDYKETIFDVDDERLN